MERHRVVRKIPSLGRRACRWFEGLVTSRREERDRAVEEHCIRHTFELASNLCRACNNGFCERCLVYPFGMKKPPYCVACAIAASGVRSTAANPRRQTTPAMAHPEPATEPASRSGRHARAPRRRPRTSQSHAGAQESSPRRAEPTTGHRATDTRRSARRPPAPGWAGCAGLSCCSSTEARRARRWPLFRFKAPSYDGLGIHAPKAAATRPLSPSVHSLAS